jgi:ABC-type phosphate transport system substrate-binding protein
MTALSKISLMLGLTIASVGMAEVAIIGHPSNPTTELAPDQIERIFLGKVTSFPNGDKAIPIDQASGAGARTEFYSKVLSKTDSQLKSYWSRIIFTGKGQPPQEETDDMAVKALIAKNPSLVGYISSQSVDNSVKVLYTAK